MPKPRAVIRAIAMGGAALAVVVGLLFLAMFLWTRGAYPVPRTAAADPSVPRVTIDGVTFHAESFGDPARPTVIVVHGGPGWDYRGLLPLRALADEYRVVFYDQRGTGLSPRVETRELSLESTLADLGAVVDHFGRGQKVRLVGHSWGAMLVSAYLGRGPDTVSHAVLAEPGFLTSALAREAGIRLGLRWEAGFLLRVARAWFESLHVDGPDPDAAMDYFMGQVAPYANPEYYCDGIVPPAGAEHWRAGARAIRTILGSARDARGELEINLVAGVERFTAPVLILAGECSRLIGSRHQAKQAALFPSASVAVIPGAGHAMFGEKPEASIRVVRAYLRS